MIARKEIQTHYKHNLIRIDADAKQATFQNLDNERGATVGYDMIHVTPPQSAPDSSSTARWPTMPAGSTSTSTRCSHRDPERVLLGDVSSLPTSKTGAAIRKEAPVLVENLLAQMRRQAPRRAAMTGTRPAR